jgi:hypothetical protein
LGSTPGWLGSRAGLTEAGDREIRGIAPWHIGCDSRRPS